jgi:hypothetical protein
MKMNFREAMLMKGCFIMRVYKSGKLIEVYEDHNLIVNGAKDAAAHLLAGDIDGKYISKIAFGTSGNIPTPDDTALKEPFIKKISAVGYPALGHVEFRWNLLASEANGKGITEFGLVCEDGTLFSRKVRDKAIPKESDIALEGEWIIIF